MLRPSRTCIALFMALLTSANLAGCAAPGLVPGTGEAAVTSRMFDLAAPAAKPVGAVSGQTKRIQLVVYEPTAIRAVDSDRVVVRRPSGEISYLSGATWNDRLPMLVRARLVEVLAGSGRFRAVSNGQDKVNADVGLSLALQTFQIDVGEAGSEARIAVQAKLVAESGGAVLASKRFEEKEPVKSKDPADHVAALNAAFVRLTAETAAWMTQSLDDALSKKTGTSGLIVGSIKRR